MLNRAFLVVSLLLFIVSILFPLQSFALFNIFRSHYTPVSAINSEVRIPVQSINDGKAHYFTFTHGSREVRFFVVKSRDNVIRAAFDACDVCFREKKGYSQDGDFMICNNCGMRFHSNRINVVKGGCNPAPLRRQVVKNDLVLTEKDILTGSRYF